ncbi:hypothetical protein LX36DRAFT_665100 [Colletotrichum falcatum]|nr:hypothetical protein LX36DRAFT_665100 [Colletotrichum falcatum]
MVPRVCCEPCSLSLSLSRSLPPRVASTPISHTVLSKNSVLRMRAYVCLSFPPLPLFLTTPPPWPACSCKRVAPTPSHADVKRAQRQGKPARTKR